MLHDLGDRVETRGRWVVDSSFWPLGGLSAMSGQRGGKRVEAFSCGGKVSRESTQFRSCIKFNGHVCHSLGEHLGSLAVSGVDGTLKATVTWVEGSDMAELKVARWTKYGHDRLYVTAPDGQRVGWLDQQTSAEHLEQPQLADEFHAALAAYRVGSGQPAPAAAPSTKPTTPVPHVPEVAAAPDWVDLATNRPGQAARTQAQAKLAAMKDRSKVGTFLARLVDAKTDERAWRVGADGEETVGSRLEKLRDHGWHILHAVPVGSKGSDIDHVLIGPGGVYTINTKTHPGGKIWVAQHAIRVNGQPVPYLRNSRFEAERASRLLTDAVGWPVSVRPVLVFLTGSLIPDVTIKQQPDDVVVLDRMDIPRAFKKAPQRLTLEQIEQLYACARRSITWKPT